jgi:hypothetical protein
MRWGLRGKECVNAVVKKCLNARMRECGNVRDNELVIYGDRAIYSKTKFITSGKHLFHSSTKVHWVNLKKIK